MVMTAGAEYLINRGGVWQYRRRVPADLVDLDPRCEIRLTTKKRDLASAAVVAAKINTDLEAYWLGLSAGQPAAKAKGAERFERAVKLARTFGVSYRSADDLARGDLDALVQRLELLEEKQVVVSPVAASAVLGGVQKPSIMITQLFASYEEHVRDRMRGKSEDQVRKWRNPRLRACNNLVDVIGDKPLAAITREDALDFRAWWRDRVLDEDMDPGSANKNLGQLGAMVRELSEAWRLGIDNPFAGLRLAGERHNPRTPYPADFVRSEILPGTRLMGLNAEARAIVQIVAATGIRPSEVAALTRSRIVLDASIPHLQIRPESRQLKTRNADRDMPLVGIALEVMREHRSGFPRYRDTPDSFSATANKAMGEAGLRPTPAHTVYSLRHTFKDRLIALEAPPRVQDALMDHAVGEIEYGAGPSLEQRATWLSRVWV